MEEEGHDPATYKFELANSDSKTPSKKARRSESTIEQETEETPAMEDMIVQDDAGDDEETEQKETDGQNAEAKMEVDDTEKTARKRDMKDDSEASEPKKACLDKDVKEDDHKTDNTDAEDSINLDLGEDELLNEEVRYYFFSVSVQLPSPKSKSNGVSNGFMMEIDWKCGNDEGYYHLQISAMYLWDRRNIFLDMWIFYFL